MRSTNLFRWGFTLAPQYTIDWIERNERRTHELGRRMRWRKRHRSWNGYASPTVWKLRRAHVDILCRYRYVLWPRMDGCKRKKKKGEKSKSMTVVCEHDQSDALAQQLCTTTTRIHKNTQKPKQIKIDFRFRTWKEKKFPDRKGESRHELFYTPSGLWHKSIKWKILVKRASSTRTTSRVQQGIRNRIDLEKSHGKWEMMWKLFFFFHFYDVDIGSDAWTEPVTVI
jgi:hypothetical protein